MQKWRRLTDAQVQEELEQIAYERQILEDAAFDTEGNMQEFDADKDEEEQEIQLSQQDEELQEKTNGMVNRFNGDNKASNIVGKESDFSKAGETALKGDDTRKRTGTSSSNKNWGWGRK